MVTNEEGASTGRLFYCRNEGFEIVNALKYIFFLVLLMSGHGLWAALPGSCALEEADGTGRVRYVYDGDTVLLEDGRRVRLIGINTPEIGRDGEPSQPLAEAARDALTEMLGRSRRVILRYGKERRDRYGRILAHLYVDSAININALLVEQGYAAAIAVPPNLDLVDCYGTVEAAVRRAGRGIWSTDYFRPVPARRLGRDARGFRLVTGVVRAQSHSRRSIWLSMDGRVALRIARKDLAYFGGEDLSRYVGRKVLVRGWVHPGRDGPVMQVRHPFSLQLLD
ncbi:MAG TPA: hypothetical protein ENJ22_02100 [Gammaproteobacteria bacterium]|nr:hypothetical protein [Gammaproteobacteria bacterium]